MTRSTKAQTKSAIVTRMLGRERGASVAELAKATGWKDHSVRAFLTRVRKKAELIKEERGNCSTTYHLAPAATANAASLDQEAETSE